MNKIYWIVMAGGSGTRFWPLSRRKRPKQLLPICTPKETQSMVEVTVERILKISSPENIIVVTGNNIKTEIINILKGKIEEPNFLFEPVGRNTAPCIGWGALHIKRRCKDAVVGVVPADHYIGNEDRFYETLQTALEVASVNYKVVTIGIIPTFPSTGYGYIEIGETIGKKGGVERGIKFVEKPDKATAELYLRSQKYLWNSGMFFFKVELILELIQKYLPDLYDKLCEIEGGIETGREEEVLEEVFPQITPISIDYGVMEKLDDFFVIRGDFIWSDVGSWEAVYELSAGAKESQRNVTLGDDLIALNSSGCLTLAPKDKLIAIIGVENLVIIDTEDALLVCPRDQSQLVNKIVEILEKEGKVKYI